MVDMLSGSADRSTDQWNEHGGGDLPDVIQLAREQVGQLTRMLAGRQGAQEAAIARLAGEMAWLLRDMAGQPALQGQQMARLDHLMNQLAQLMNDPPRNRG